jgi:class 3 adenylate cyclase/predicted ATPase
MTCRSCGTENPGGSRYCGGCGAPLSEVCAACGAANDPTMRFCTQCGSPLGEPVAAHRRTTEARPTRPTPTAERRLVSVLFADLVGFTTIAESRDSEDVRELLSRYFDLARTLVERYGGTVEKFIGDAVMAVWGTPVAQEDDAERAVRTALDLVQAVRELDPVIYARAGVLTGEAAVTMGAEGQGMVAGDLVNTAARLQAVAEAGTVLVGDVTRRATEAAILYEDAGAHALKGKAEPVSAFRAKRVTAGRGGALKSEGLEPPFTGRERELRLVKALFHASTEEQKAHFVNVVGIAGIGKSRLSWEFYKYIDGLIETVWWHRGRCLAYGEGVAYWALAEMVRMRCGVVEGEDPGTARAKVAAAVAEHVASAEEREWIEPRLAHLLGLDDHAVHERDDLFAAWRLFFERLADINPVVLVFEDMQWADVALLDFVEHLLEWSRQRPIFVLSLARPELGERFPDFAKAIRNATTLSLEPLAAGAMEALLDGFAPGLPVGLRGRILDRAEGVPLYAVETVRMLLDRGLLRREGDAYRPTGDVDVLDVPETLHALVSARLDGLSPDERRLILDACVLGKTFTTAALADLCGLSEAELEPLLSSLTRKEILGRQADPRSPERGQYGFVQDLLKRVAYETLSRKERKARHLAAAEYLERAWGAAEHEIVEVVAAHYVSAFETAPDADDAGRITAKAREHLARAGERAASLAAHDEAQRYFDQAVALADDPSVRATLLERSGEAAHEAGRFEDAEARLQRAVELLAAAGETNAAGRVSARLGETMWQQGRLGEAVTLLGRSFDVLSAGDPNADLAAVAAQLGRFLWFTGDHDNGLERVELALDIAETLRLTQTIVTALMTKAGILVLRRPEEALALFERSLALALENGFEREALRAYFNLTNVRLLRAEYEDALDHAERSLELARKRGNAAMKAAMLGLLAEVLTMTGRWDDAIAASEEALEATPLHGLSSFISLASALGRIHTERGELEPVRALLDRIASWRESEDIQEQAVYWLAAATLGRAEGRFAEALAAAAEAKRAGLSSGAPDFADAAWVEQFDAAFALEDLELVDDLLHEFAALQPVQVSRFLEAHAARASARLAAARGEQSEVEQPFKTAQGIFREYGIPFWLAVTQLEHAEWLTAQGRRGDAEPLLAEAGDRFERLGATPWLERLARVERVEPTHVLA